MSLANIALHFIVKDIPEVKNHTNLFQRFIDDIIYITQNEEHNKAVKNALTTNFERYGLELTYREISTKKDDQEIEFLDVLHVSDEKATNGFYTKDYVKPTAIGQAFLNGSSHHPRHVFKAIIVGEANRMRRLNETKEGFDESIRRLEQKCIKSNFNRNLISETLKTISWNNSSTNNSISEKKQEDRIPWATQFKGLIKLGKLERELAPRASITFCRPPTLANILLNHKKIAIGVKTRNNNNTVYRSSKCGRCGLCGHYGTLKNMVWETNHVNTLNGRTVDLKEHLTCSDYGIYAGRCRECGETYTGQTKNSFARRWNKHRSTWNTMMGSSRENDRDTTESNFHKDNQALFVHYKKFHNDRLLSEQLELSSAYEVVFLEKPKLDDLNIRENYWIGRLKSRINIAKTYLPTYR